ncbi:MAG: DJ-1/PfpI family protein [Candidatus Geothermincolia bacterium]
MGRLDGKKVLVLLAPDFQENEAAIPISRLVEAGADVDVASLEKGMLVGHNQKASISAEFKLSEIDAAVYDAVVVPGGKSPAALAEDPAALEIIKLMYESGRPVCAIGYGPLLLAAAGVLSGKTITGWPGIKKEVQRSGATFVNEPVWVDQNVITAKEAKDVDRFVSSVYAALD